MKRNSASKSSNGVEAVQEVGQIPLTLIQAQTHLKTYIDGFADEDEDDYADVARAYAHLDAVLKYIGKGDCDLSALNLSEAQREVFALVIQNPEWAKSFMHVHRKSNEPEAAHD